MCKLPIWDSVVWVGCHVLWSFQIYAGSAWWAAMVVHSAAIAMHWSKGVKGFLAGSICIWPHLVRVLGSHRD